MKTTDLHKDARRLLRVILLLTGIGFVSCEEDEVAPASPERVEISPGITLGEAQVVSTKAPVDVANALTLYFARANETALNSSTYGSYSTTALSATRTAGTGATALTFSPTEYYPLNDLKTRLVGWYPAATSFTGGVVSWTFDGTQDILTAAEQTGSARSTISTVTFNHKLAQLKFNLYADDTDAQSAWGAVSAIQVTAQRNTSTFTLASGAATGAVAFTGTADKSLTVSGATSTTPPIGADNATQFGSPIMIEPQTSASYVLNITVTTANGGTVTVALPAQAYAAGSSRTVTLKMTMLRIEPQSTISSWVNGGSRQNIYPYVLDNKYIVAKDAFGSASPIHPNWTETPIHYLYDSENGFSTKFEVAATDALVPGTSAIGQMNWYLASGTYDPAYNKQSLKACQAPWRLPTYNETQQLRFLSTDGFVYNGYYWAASLTTSNTKPFSRVSIRPFLTEYGDERQTSYVRCVRDVSYPYVEDGKYIVSQDMYGSSRESIHPCWSQTPDHQDTDLHQNGVSARFEVAQSDEPVTGNPQNLGKWDTTNGTCTAPWRRPTLKELQTIMMLKSQLTVDAFSIYGYWASTAKSISIAWQVNSNGLANAYYTSGNIAVTRCVRDNTYPYLAEGKYIVSKDMFGSSGETLHPNWVESPLHLNTDASKNCVSAKFEVAADFAKHPETASSTSINGYIAAGETNNGSNPKGLKACSPPWRLPTIAELLMIKSLSSIDVANCWSSTLSTLYEAYLSRADGSTSFSSRANSAKVRCVRDI